MAEAGKPSTSPLRAYRERRGLTQGRVADEIAQLAWYRKETHVGINADMVSKWERGTKAVSSLYQELLCDLFGATREQLGFREPESQAAGPDGEGGSGGVIALLTRLGEAASLLGPAVLDTWKVEQLKRRTLLELMGAAPETLTLGAPTRASARVTQQLDTLADGYQTLYHSSAPLDLMAPVVTHLRTIGTLLRQHPALGERRQLLRNRSRVATLAGRIAFFDLDDPMSARGYYNVAVEAAGEANDRLLAATALGHMSFIPVAEHSFTAAQDYLRGARQHLDRSPHAGVSSWLAAVETEIHTNSRAELAALEAVDRARDALDAGPGQTLSWFDYYDAARLAGFTGYAMLRFGRLDEATNTLGSALESLPLQAVKQRAVFLADLAAVRIEAREVDEACRIACRAADALQLAGYATGTGRLVELRSRLEPWKTHPGVRALDDRMRVA
jgi:transcriptional regulator with XRE-family HTH domain